MNTGQQQGGQQGHGPEDEADDRQEDGPERAFGVLREEVAAQGRKLDLVYRELQQIGRQLPVAGPDYTPTLGKMEQALGIVAERLGTVERRPAMRMTGESLRAELDTAVGDAAMAVVRPLAGAVSELRSSTRDMNGLIKQVRGRREQQAWLWTVGGLGALGGVALWFMLVALLPAKRGDWLAALPINGSGPWAAAETLMQRDDFQLWDKLARLNQACGDRSTDLCVAAIRVGTLTPRAQEDVKPPPVTTPLPPPPLPQPSPPSRPLPRSRAGQPAQ